MGEVHEFRSRYAARSEAGKRRKAAALRDSRARRSQGFAMVPESVLPILAKRDLGVGLILLLVMRSGLVTTRRNDGWVMLPVPALAQIGLDGRQQRHRIVRDLISTGILETRQTHKGAALEYRLRPAGTRKAGI